MFKRGLVFIDFPKKFGFAEIKRLDIRPILKYLTYFVNLINYFKENIAVHRFSYSVLFLTLHQWFSKYGSRPKSGQKMGRDKVI